MSPRVSRMYGAFWAPFLLLLLASQDVHAVEATLRKLAFSDTWLSLLHAHPDRDGKYVTRAVTPGFLYSSKVSSFDPYLEIRTAYDRFHNPSTRNNAVCEYPARFVFLSRHFQLDETALEKCKFLDELILRDLLHSEISVVYAAGYLGNPASYYGHMMLRIKGQGTSQKLFDRAINFGAINSSADNPVSYILKGLFGGYQAAFSVAPYYLFANQYNALENRDLWVYKLSLPSKDKTLLLLHLSEVLPHKFDYFFTSRNCVSAFANLFGTVDRDIAEVTKRRLVYPQIFLRALVDSTVAEVRIDLEAARTTNFRERFSALSESQIEYIGAIMDGAISPDTNLEMVDQRVALDALGDYALGFSEEEDRKPLTQRLALTQLGLPSGSPALLNYDSAAKPHTGRYPSMISWGLAANEDELLRLVRLRPAFYDELDGAGLGFGARALSMMDFSLGINESGAVDVQRASLIRLRDLDLTATGFGEDDRVGWSGEVYWEQEDSQLCLAGCSGFGGSYGLDSVIVNRGNLSVSASLKGLIHQESADRDLLSATGDFTVRYANASTFSASATIGKNFGLGGRDRSVFRLGVWVGIDDTSGVRFEFQDYFRKSLQISWAHYF